MKQNMKQKLMEEFMKVGIIGCGKIAQVRHIPEYADRSDVEIAGFYDWNGDRVAELVDEYGGHVYSSEDELLADPSIDAVSVCVANNAHAKVTIKALNAGKHVLCEKPMAVTLEECEEMVEASKKNGKKLMIGQNQRFAKAHVYAKQLIKDGLIGEVITFTTTFGHGGPETWGIDGKKNTWFFDKSRSGMGAMADLGVHKTDLIQYLLDSPVQETTAKVITLDKRDDNGQLIGVDDNAICIYKMQSGVVGVMKASWTFYGMEDNSTVLYGTKGIMEIYKNPEHSIVVTLKDGEKIYYDIDKIQTNDNQTKSGIIDAFVDCIAKDEKPPVDGEDVLNAMKAIFASIESSETGKTIKIK